jgi:ATP-binding cassette, subfamily C, bacterial exporter for protease/lipase
VGEQALVHAIADLRRRGKTIVLITHRMSIIGITNKLLLLRDGVAQMFGPTDQVLNALAQANQEAAQKAQQAQQAQLAQQQAAQQQAAQGEEQAQIAAANDSSAVTEQE